MLRLWYGLLFENPVDTPHPFMNILECRGQGHNLEHRSRNARRHDQEEQQDRGEGNAPPDHGLTGTRRLAEQRQRTSRESP